MHLLLILLAIAGVAPAAGPAYSSESIVGAASYEPGALAPNSLASVYGTDLSYGTRAVQGEDVRNSVLPTVLPNTGTRVVVGGLAASLLYVSPTQVNFLIPSVLIPGDYDVRVVRDALYGPPARVTIRAAAPALFATPADTAIATHADGSVIDEEHPAVPGQWVVLYATGLGLTDRPPVMGELARVAASITRKAEFKVWISGQEVEKAAVIYAGVTPGFAGLYQVNFRLPESTERNPEVRIGFEDAKSRAGVRLSVRPPE